MSTPRRLAIASLTGLAEGVAGRYRQDLSRDQTLDELRRISGGDPDVLAEAVARYVVPLARPAPWDDEAAALLIDAGADPARVEHYAAARRTAKRSFSLGAFAEGINQLDSAHGQQPSATR